MIEDDDGRIVPEAVVVAPAEQAWFWSDRWQAMEREADADISAGATTVVDGAGALLDVFAPDA